MSEKIRVIDTGHLDAATNMALDEVMLQARLEGAIPDTLRFLSFKPHSVLVGHFQSVKNEVRVDYCNRNGIDINRRITGGGALYWDEKDVGWEFFGLREGIFAGKDLEAFYRMFCTAASKGINLFGLDSAFRPRNDIEIEGKKISGTGGTSLGKAFMFQGTLLVDIDIDIMLRALRVPTEKLKYSEISSLKQRLTWLSRELGYSPDRKEIIEKLTEGITGHFGFDFYPGELTDQELKALGKKKKAYSSSDYIFRYEKDPGQDYVFSYHRSEKGVIKSACNIDVKRKVLKNTYITGDFFAYPRRCVYDLESILKNQKLSKKDILDKIEGFFRDYNTRISGITEGSIKSLISSCIDKLQILEMGISIEEINEIYPVCRPFTNEETIEILLLPYCAKEPGCEYRYSQGCSSCGDCSIGDAIDISEEYGIDHITITSFEHLKETLYRLKKEGIKYFAGCCCEAFFLKHLEDFEEIGLAGILINIDSSTCYDLGKEDDAYAGKFEGFTDIKLGLLRKVLESSLGAKR